MSVAYEHIACFIDETEAASSALRHAAYLRDRTGGRLSVVHVLAPPAFLVTMAASLGGAAVHDPVVEHEAAEMWLVEEARSVGGEAVLLQGHPASTAVDWAGEHGVDALVAATHRGLVERALLGSFAGYLVHHAPCAVLLVPPAPGEGS